MRFARHAADRRSVLTLFVEGAAVEAREGDTVAAALLAAGLGPLRRNRADGTARAPYCMMGVCFECLLAIDGATRQSCLVPARDGMRVERTG